jgi:hypothetical protein
MQAANFFALISPSVRPTLIYCAYDARAVPLSHPDESPDRRDPIAIQDEQQVVPGRRDVAVGRALHGQAGGRTAVNGNPDVALAGVGVMGDRAGTQEDDAVDAGGIRCVDVEGDTVGRVRRRAGHGWAGTHGQVTRG